MRRAKSSRLAGYLLPALGFLLTISSAASMAFGMSGDSCDTTVNRTSGAVSCVNISCTPQTCFAPLVAGAGPFGSTHFQNCVCPGSGSYWCNATALWNCPPGLPCTFVGMQCQTTHAWLCPPAWWWWDPYAGTLCWASPPPGPFWCDCI